MGGNCHGGSAWVVAEGRTPQRVSGRHAWDAQAGEQKGRMLHPGAKLRRCAGARRMSETGGWLQGRCS